MDQKIKGDSEVVTEIVTVTEDSEEEVIQIEDQETVEIDLGAVSTVDKKDTMLNNAQNVVFYINSARQPRDFNRDRNDRNDRDGRGRSDYRGGDRRGDRDRDRDRDYRHKKR
jgi:hypothetical protein